MWVKKQQLELYMEQLTSPKLGRVWQGYIESLSLLNLSAEYIMWNAGLNESQAGIKIAGRNINNLRYTDDTTLMAKSEELKSLLIRVIEESEKAGWKLIIQKSKIMALSPITSWQTEVGKVEAATDFLFFGSKISVDSDSSQGN